MSNPLTTVTVLNDTMDFKKAYRLYDIKDKTAKTYKYLYRSEISETLNPINVGDNPPKLFTYMDNPSIQPTELTPSKYSVADDTIYTPSYKGFKYISGYLNDNNNKGFTIGGNYMFAHENKNHFGFSFPQNRTIFLVQGGNGGDPGNSMQVSQASSTTSEKTTEQYCGGGGGGGGQVVSLKIDYVVGEIVSIDLFFDRINIFINYNNRNSTKLISYGLAGGRTGGNAYFYQYSPIPGVGGNQGGNGGNKGGDGGVMDAKAKNLKGDPTYRKANGKEGASIITRFFCATTGSNNSDIYVTRSDGEKSEKIKYEIYKSITQGIHKGGKGGDSGEMKYISQPRAGARSSFSLYYPSKADTYGEFTIFNSDNVTRPL